MEFGDCTRTYKEHGHSVSSIIENDGLGKKKFLKIDYFILSYSKPFIVLLVYTACGDGNARCFDAKSGALKRTFKGHTGALNCLKVQQNFFVIKGIKLNLIDILLFLIQLVGERLFTGSFDSTLKVWDASELFAERSSGEKPKRKQQVDDDEIHQKMTIENEKAFHRGSDLDGSMNQDQFNEFDENESDRKREAYREEEMV